MDIRLPVYSVNEACKILGVTRFIFEKKIKYHLTRLEKRHGKEIFLQQEINTLNEKITRYEIID
jgi:hypothetical protein